MSRVWAAYNAALEKNPLLVKALTSLTGFTVGDVLAQKFVMPDEEKGYDLARTVRLGTCDWAGWAFLRGRDRVQSRAEGGREPSDLGLTIDG